MKMKRRTASAITLVLLAASLSGMFVPEGNSYYSTRGSFATHDSGNFTLIIDDDGGATGWNTLEFPKGADRLSSAYFGLGMGSDKVDFGKEEEFQTIDPINISSPGNHTNEEGFCSFRGWTGEDFENFEITQRTYLNRYRENTRGYNGRWMVIDYEIFSQMEVLAPVHLIQTMNVDLGLSASDDRFSFLSDINSTVISDGTTFVGLGMFDPSASSYFNGFNSGVYGPGVYSGESEVWGQMSSPNNHTSDAQQDWYMDITARVDPEDTSGPFHVSFIVMVGNSLFEIRSAYNDAINGLNGRWTGPDLPTWSRGSLDLSFEYQGPAEPESVDLNLTYASMGGPSQQLGVFNPVYDEISGNYTFRLNTSSHIDDWGSLGWKIDSRSRFGFRDRSDQDSFQVDNKGPDTTMLAVNDDPPGTLSIITNAGDRGGSGIYSTFLSVDGVYYIPAETMELYDDGNDFDFYAYTADLAGNIGPTVELLDQVNDGTPPDINIFDMDPVDIDENTEGPVKITLKATDIISGIDPDSARIRYGPDGVLSQWMKMNENGMNFTHYLDMNWEALQGSELTITVEISDELGNSKDMTIKEYIEPLNDPPEFTMSLSGERWSSDDIGITLSGSDPDGDNLTISFDYRLGDGNWRDVPAFALEATDLYHYLFDVPEETFEGPMSIQCTINDGTDSISLPVATRDIDMKAPTLTATGHPGTLWSRETVNLRANATDSGSGVSITGFMVDDGDGFEFMPSGSIGLQDDGIYNVTAMAEDKAGNTRTIQLDVIRVDKTAPVISDVTIPSNDLDPGRDLEIEFDVSDTLGFDPAKVNKDPSLFITAMVLSGPAIISLGTVIPIMGSGYKARFIDPFASGVEGDTVIRISVVDEAGNPSQFESSALNISDSQGGEKPPYEITYPEKVAIGEDFEIVIAYDGLLILEVQYPGAMRTWIIPSQRTSGDERTYDLPGSYAPGEIGFRVAHGSNEEGNDTITYPVTWYAIILTDWSDSDGDGLSNAFESRHGLDPSVPDDVLGDEDGDGLALLEEMYNLTDPDEKDSDSDGMDDLWEAEKGTLPFRNDRNEDPDRDDWFNFKEFDAGTDPRDPNDTPKEPPATQWYWIVLIVSVLLAIIGYFIYQMLNRRKLEDDLEAMDEEMSWDPPSGK
jgi:hypothetical protein